MMKVSPQILKEGDYSIEDIALLKEKNDIRYINNIYEKQIEEIFEIDNPQLIGLSEYQNELQKYKKQTTHSLAGDWIYFPWNGALIHCVCEPNYYRLRTNRNRDLITTQEQTKLYNSRILIMGLSVGNSIVTTLAYAGIARNLILADFDTIETANLNRLRAGIHEVGKPKISLAAEQIYEINPYAHLELYSDGIKEGDLLALSETSKLPDLIFDEIDDFEMKVRLRIFAKVHKKPLVMLTSLGDNVLIDVERYDKEPQQRPFQGIVAEEILDRILTGKVSEKDRIKYAMILIGQQYIPTRALGSLLEIRHSLVGRPQLASTIAIDGGLATIIARMILLNEGIKGGQYYLDSKKLVNLPSDTGDSEQRTNIVQAINKVI